MELTLEGEEAVGSRAEGAWWRVAGPSGAAGQVFSGRMDSWCRVVGLWQSLGGDRVQGGAVGSSKTALESRMLGRNVN